GRALFQCFGPLRRDFLCFGRERRQAPVCRLQQHRRPVVSQLVAGLEPNRRGVPGPRSHALLGDGLRFVVGLASNGAPFVISSLLRRQECLVLELGGPLQRRQRDVVPDSLQGLIPPPRFQLVPRGNAVLRRRGLCHRTHRNERNGNQHEQRGPKSASHVTPLLGRYSRGFRLHVAKTELSVHDGPTKLVNTITRDQSASRRPGRLDNLRQIADSVLISPRYYRPARVNCGPVQVRSWSASVCRPDPAVGRSTSGQVGWFGLHPRGGGRSALKRKTFRLTLLSLCVFEIIAVSIA